MAKFLMCSPDYFSVEYSINPWMHPEEWKKEFSTQAHDQWIALYTLLENLGHEIEVVQGNEGCPDMCFVANAGIFHDGLYLAGCMRKKEREFDCVYYDTYIASRYESIAAFPMPFQEGAGDCLFDKVRNYMWAGYGQRSEKASVKWIKEIYPDLIDVVGLELVDPRFYHLDTCFCPLTRGEIVYYPDAFSENSRWIIETVVNKKHRIDLYDKEANAFCANMICVDNDIIMPQWDGDLPNELQDKYGYKVHMLDMSAFIKAGGACKCLVLRLDQ